MSLRVTNINSVVASVQVELNNFDERNRLSQLAIEGAQDAQIYLADSVKIAYKKMNDVNQISLPSDFVDYTKIGIKVNGVLWTFTRNENLAISPTDSELVMCDYEEANNTTVAPSDKGSCGFAPHYRNGEYCQLYGVGGGFNSVYFRIDMQRRVIFFSNNYPGDIIIEYTSSGISPSTVIPIQLVPVIKAYVHWKYVEYDRNVSLSEKYRKEELYDKEIAKFQFLNLSFTGDEFLDAVREGYHQAVK